MTAVLFMLCLFWVVPAWATVYFTNNQVGTDNNDCPAANQSNRSGAKGTITGGMSCLTPGDTLLVMGAPIGAPIGVNLAYQEHLDIPTSGTDTDWIVIAAYPGTTVILRPNSVVGSSFAAIRFNAKHHILFDGFNLDMSALNGTGAGTATKSAIGIFGSNNIYLQALEIHDCSSETHTTPCAAILADGASSAVTLNLNYIHDIGNDGGNSINGGLGIVLGGGNHVVNHNHVTKTASYGILMWNPTTNNSNNVLSRNYIHDIGSDALVIGNGTSSSALNNIIVTTGTNTIADSNNQVGTGYGIVVGYGATTFSVYNNTIVGTRQNPIQIRAGEASGTAVRNNLLYLNGGANAIADGGTSTTQDHNVVSTTTPFQ